MPRIPTVRIKHPDGYAIINADRFDPTVHEKWQETPSGGGVPQSPEDVDALGKAEAAEWLEALNLDVPKTVQERRDMLKRALFVAA